MNPPAATKLAALAALLAWPALAQTPPAAPPKPPSHHHHRHHRKTPHTVAQAAPPAAPQAAPEPGSPAPVPDEAITSPDHGPAPHTQVSPSIMSLHYPPVGEGYVEGSSPQAMDDRNAAKAPGLEVTVPIAPAAPTPLPPVGSPQP